MAELMGMPIGTSGILTSGGTMASNTALIVARYAKAGFNVRQTGLQGVDHPRLLMYGSTETHSWAERAAELLGLGTSAYRQAPVDSEFRVDVAARHPVHDHGIRRELVVDKLCPQLSVYGYGRDHQWSAVLLHI